MTSGQQAELLPSLPSPPTTLGTRASAPGRAAAPHEVRPPRRDVRARRGRTVDPGVPSPLQGPRPALRPLPNRFAQVGSPSPPRDGGGLQGNSHRWPIPSPRAHAPPPPSSWRPAPPPPPPLGRRRRPPGQRSAGRLLPCALPRESVSSNFSRWHVLSASTTTTTTYHTIPYHTIPYHTIPYHTIPYHTIPYHTIPYHTIPMCFASQLRTPEHGTCSSSRTCSRARASTSPVA